jgi:signal transduction histidine kinase
MRPLTRRSTVLGPAVIAIVVGAVILVALRRADESATQLTSARTTIQVLAALEGRLIDAESQVRGFVMTGDAAFRPEYHAARDSARIALDSLLRHPSPRMTRGRLDSLSALVARRLDLLDSAVVLWSDRRFTGYVTPPVTPPGRVAMARIREMLAAMRTEEVAFLQSEGATERGRRRVVALIVAIGSVLTAFLALATNGLLDRFATDRERAAAEQERLVVELEAANRTKAEFLTRMSHELRTPLNAIDGYAELLSMGIHGALNDNQQRDVDRIRRSGRHLLALINDILSFAKLEAGQVEVRSDTLVLHDALAAIEPLIGRQVSDKGLTYRYSPVDPAIVVRGDPERIRQILLNLVTNAIKFTDAGGAIMLTAETDAAFARIRVADTGWGIAPDKLQRVFQPFVQVGGGARPSSGEGLGLGLTISRDLARRMGGDVTAESRLGEGSVFEFTIPLMARTIPGFRAVRSDATETPWPA